jgi:hypothetical protein
MRYLLVLCLAVVSCVAQAQDHMRKTALPTPLDVYVATPDSNYRYELVSKEERDDWTSYTRRPSCLSAAAGATVSLRVWRVASPGSWR